MDPIERLRTHLLAAGIIDEAWLAAADEELEDFGAELRSTCRAVEDITLGQVFDEQLAEPGDYLAEERADCLDWLATVPSRGGQA